MAKNKVIIGIVVVVLIIGGWVLFAPSSENGVQEVQAGQYDTFAQCLYDSGMRMYGSATCSSCAKQRRDFGNSFHFIKEIECDPRNDAEEAKKCTPKNITHTPTWIHEDAEGNELFRFDSGVVKLEDLASQSGCPLIKDDLGK